MLLIRDLPKYETLLAHARRYPNVEPAAYEAFLVLLRVASDVLAVGEEFLARHGLSQGRFTVLMLLNREPDQGVSPSNLASRAGVTRATMTGLLDGLEREGLISRQEHAVDRRMVTVRLTETGLKRLDEILPDYFGRVANLMRGLSDDQRHTLVTLLRQVGEGVPAFRESAVQPQQNGSPTT